MNFNEYQKESKKTWKENYNNDFIRAILGLVGEAGEIADKIKKEYRDSSEEVPNTVSPLKKVDMAYELGDCLYYLARIGEYYGLTLEEIARFNISKLEDRAKRGKIGGKGDHR